MRPLPDAGSFASVYNAGQAQVVWADLTADLETPVSAFLKLARSRPGSLLLESVEGGETRGRYSILGTSPDLVWRCFGNCAEIARGDGSSMPTEYRAAEEPAMRSLRALVAESRIALPPALPPMAAALVGYAGYDMVRLVERLPDENPDRAGLPDAVFVRPTTMVVFDTVTDVLSIVTPVFPAQGYSAAEAYAAARARLEDAVAAIEGPLPKVPRVASAAAATPTEMQMRSDVTREGYHRMVKRAKEYIASGDIFQVVPSQCFRAPFALDPLALYRALRRLNPSPFLFFLDFGEFALVGSSPEVLVRVRDDVVTVRPIAGTRPRGTDPEDDDRLANEMLADPKERAEHLMLLDLGRNDVGRVARIGTVRVTQEMAVERYSHVMHLVSNVEGRLDPEFDAMAALWAGFPAGTVSGAPKVRAMEIIDELERERRGVYAGAVGYFAADGSMDTCIALRTAVIKDGEMAVRAGGGVVADSDPDAEYRESRNKAKALFRAAEEAERFARQVDRTV